MIMRKTNASLSLLSSGLLLMHAISLAAWMLSKGAVPKAASLMPWILTGVVAIHALISMGYMISIHRSKQKMAESMQG